MIMVQTRCKMHKICPKNLKVGYPFAQKKTNILSYIYAKKKKEKTPTYCSYFLEEKKTKTLNMGNKQILYNFT